MKRTGFRGRGVNLIVMVPGLLLSSCGGSDDPDASASDRAAVALVTNEDIDACALVTTAEAAEALGVATAEADRPSAANIETRSPSYSGGDDIVIRLRTCRFTGERGPAIAVLTVMVRQSSDPIESKIGFQGMREAYSEWSTDMPGLGEQAFWVEGLNVLLGGGLQLSISGDIDGETARALASRAMERLR
jgi:hypothetical protein